MCVYIYIYIYIRLPQSPPRYVSKGCPSRPFIRCRGRADVSRRNVSPTSKTMCKDAWSDVRQGGSAAPLQQAAAGVAAVA